ncbi:MAG: gentisate 1,2-dioxygenase [Chloroflexi bacterium]|nr:gentisate 1,2-dioxygenase [Chloroflexota bacterium]
MVEGVREDWAPGDLVLLPIKPGGVEHQHFDAEPPQGARWLAFLYLPHFQHLASAIRQVENSPGYQQRTGTAAVVVDDDTPYNPNRDFTGFPRDSFGAAVKTNNGFNGYSGLMKRRDDERARVAEVDTVVHGDALAWETNPQGIMQWYLHPDLPERLLRSYLFYRQEIPGESRSGKQKHQGGAIFFFTEGRGHTIIDGERFDWEKEDLIQLPLRPDGVAYQHFNDSRGPARLIACEPNYFDSLGFDRGSGLVQLANCPEYDRL